MGHIAFLLYFDYIKMETQASLLSIYTLFTKCVELEKIPISVQESPIMCGLKSDAETAQYSFPHQAKENQFGVVM